MRMTEQEKETCRKLREAAERLAAGYSDDTSDEQEYTMFPEVGEGWRQ